MSAIASPTFAQFKEKVTQEWTDEATVGAWRRWHEKWSTQTQALTSAVAQAARLRPGLRVLDLASGSGEPALTIAEAVGPNGTVTATDLSAGMVAITADHARKWGIPNLVCQQEDAENLSFPDATFDVVTSRLGVMFFPDSARAQGEISRVLKPGGRVAYVTWGQASEQQFFQSTVGVFARYAQLPPPPPDAPTPFRYGQPEALAAVMCDAGFRQVEVERQTIAFPWYGPPKEYLQHFLEVAAPFRGIVAALSPEQREQAASEAVAAMRQYDDGKRLNFTAVIVVASGVR